MSRIQCKGLIKPELKTECSNPLMILKSLPQTELDSTEIKQVITFGCLNPNCSMYGVEVDRVVHDLETFN